jgi:PDZ domain
MSGPRHLWSGDWESESAKTADNLAGMPAPVFDEPAAEPEPQAAAKRRWTRRQLAIALTTGVAAAAVTVALVTTLGGSDHKPRAHKHAAPAAQPQRPTGGQAPSTQPCQKTQAGCTRATPVVSGPTANWMGMQIVTSPAGIVISTIRLGSLPDRVGFEPGDEIQQINGHGIATVDQIRQETANIAIGQPVTIQVLRGSVVPEVASMPLTERPTIHP